MACRWEVKVVRKDAGLVKGDERRLRSMQRLDANEGR